MLVFREGKSWEHILNSMDCWMFLVFFFVYFLSEIPTEGSIGPFLGSPNFSEPPLIFEILLAKLLWRSVLTIDVHLRKRTALDMEDTAPKFDSSPLKMDAWKTTSFWEANFSGASCQTSGAYFLWRWEKQHLWGWVVCQVSQVLLSCSVFAKAKFWEKT